MDRSASDPLFGQLLDGRYLVGSRIARGGMATVYEATDLRLDRQIAIKVVPEALAEDEMFSQRFVREARAAARLTHPNVVTVYDQGEDGGVLFLAMEYVPGRHTLRDVIRDETPLAPKRALSLLEEILKAIAAAHEAGVVHRDIKPENVLITPHGQVKVADFGLARAVSSATAATATGGVLMGTVSYLPPELVTDGAADARADVYALGVLTFELLTGAKPHTGDSPIQIAYKHVHEDVPPPSSLAEGIPPYVDAFVARATSRQRDLRPADAHVMLQQLRRVRQALESGVVDDQELTDDLTPTIALAATAPGIPAALHPSAAPAGRSADNDVFDIATYDDFVDARVRPTMSVAAATHVERTLRVGDRPPAGLGAPPEGPTALTPASREYSRPAPPSPPPPLRPYSGRRGWVALLVVLLLAAGAAAGGWWYGVGRFQKTPDIIGLTQTQAERSVESAGLTFKVGRTAYSEVVPVGAVISSDPDPGDKVLKDGTVEVVVSRGPERHPVPDLSGMSEEEARQAIADSHLRVGEVVGKYDDDIAKGEVISFSPKAGTELKRNAPVTVFVSKGPAPIRIDDYTGQRAKPVVQRLTAAGLTVNRDYQYDDGVAKGLIVTQSPTGVTLYPGDAIDVTISRGPHLVEVPDVHFFGTDDAKATLEAAGFKVKEKKADVYYGLGFVVDQSPDGGAMAPYGSEVTIFVS